MKGLRYLFLALLIVISFNRGSACFILFLNDGKQILVGNHEDWLAKDAGKFGSVIFTFLSEGWAQGGMNEKGLFFDAAHTPFHEIRFDVNARKFPGYIWQSVLDKCSSVEDALRFLKTYELPELSETHVMLADATGKAVIVGVYNGKIAIKPFVKSYLMQTNFNPWHPELSEEPTCWRYNKAEKHLATNSVSSVENMKSILEQTHQESLTVYSNIYDLKNKVIYIFNKRNFNKALVTRLSDSFAYGECTRSLDSLETDSLYWSKCKPKKINSIRLSGKVIEAGNGKPIPYCNIGLFEKNIGTLSDPDGSFELTIPAQHENDSIIFSSIGFDKKKIHAPRNGPIRVELTSTSTILREVIFAAKKKTHKKARLGWMGGRDGVLPFDTVQGGGGIALLIQSPSVPFQVEKLQVRLMYNSKDTCKLRLHFYGYDTVHQTPSNELLSKEIILKENKRFGWMRFDLSEYDIHLDEKYFCVAFEWIDDRQTRKSMLAGLQDWEKWKKGQFEMRNKNVEKIDDNGKAIYKYHGNMMNWPGFKNLPPFTGLMVKTGKDKNDINLRTFERKTSFGRWYEMQSTLNAVVTVAY